MQNLNISKIIFQENGKALEAGKKSNDAQKTNFRTPTETQSQNDRQTAEHR